MENFFRTVDKARPVYDAVYKFTLFLCKILLIGDILLVSFAVLARYLEFIPHQAWVEEVAPNLILDGHTLGAIQVVIAQEA
ncbi:MAG: hypothetical protein J6M44_00135, partial [Butyrivibrio sp.]|nr:hypothetical protein [Butyrivibrio sp.]